MPPEPTHTALDAQDLIELIDGVPDLVQSVHADGRIAFVNSSWLARLGYRADEIIGRSIFEVIAPDSQEHCRHAMQRLAAGEDVGIIEVTFRTRSGEDVTLEGRATMRFDSDGQPACTRGVFREIVSRGWQHAPYERIREQRRLFHSVLSILRANTTHERADFLGFVTRKVSHALGVARVGVWLFGERRDALSCAHLFDRGRSVSAPGERLLRKEHPGFFEAIESRIPVRADHAPSHLATQSLATPYLAIHGVSAMLCTPIRLGENLVGVLSCEQAADAPIRPGTPSSAEGRRWTNDEEEFVLAVSAIMLIYLESERRSMAEQMLHELNGELEQMVEIRTTDLARSEARLQHLITSTPTVIYTCEPTAPYRTTFISPNIARNFGYEAEEFTRDPMFWIERIHPEDLPHVTEQMRAVETTGGMACEYRFRRRDGSYHWVRDQLALLRDDHGTPMEMAGSWVDIHDRRLAESSARSAATDLRRIIDTANAPIIGIDSAGRINEWNHCVEHITGFMRSEMLGRPVTDASTAPHVGELSNLLACALGGDSPENREIMLSTRDGPERLLLMNASARRAASGARAGAVAIGQDITELRAAEQRSLRAQRLESIGTLAGGVAHDVNNALAPILLATGLFRRRHPESNDLIEIMEASAKRGASMVRQLLTFAKGVQGERAPLASESVFREIEQFVRSTFPKDIAAEFRCAPELPTVLGDATQLHQVLLNLCVNARDAMPSGGSLRVEASRRTLSPAEARRKGAGDGDGEAGDYVVWRVTDSGPGIPPELQERIFEPFFSTKSLDRGTGLGLSTVAGIVRSHGGFLRVDSRPGAGASFSIYLPNPQVQAMVPPANGVTTVKPAASLSDASILVVDDEPAVREICTKMLASLGAKVHSAADGRQALELLERIHWSVDAVVTDLHMPGMDGITLARRIRGVAPRLPIVLSSGHAGQVSNGRDDTRESDLSAFDAQLDKPFAPDALVEVLQPLIRTAAASRATARGDAAKPRDCA
ncbi:MAG: PAS domain S-box protein [Phycisphaerales bacterium]